MRTIGVVTTARSDYGVYQSLLRAIHTDPEFCLELFVSGMHLSPEFGLTVKEIEQDGFLIKERVEMSLSSDSAEGIAKSMGLGTIGFAQAFARSRPDILLVLGDRFEMHASVCAAVPFRIPIAHIGGGALTFGAIDESFRHSITKMSHLHLVEIEEYANRILQMGEEPWRVLVTGAIALDNIFSTPLLSLDEINLRFGLSLSQPPLLVTFHPETLHADSTRSHIMQLLRALDRIKTPIVFTKPNADTGGRCIISAIEDYLKTHPDSYLVDSLGAQAYYSLMSHAVAMVGNSSSGIIEAASFKLPVVNIGNRQEGRFRARNIIDVPHEADAITQGIHKAQSHAYRESLYDLNNPYGNGKACARILQLLKSIPLNETLIIKRFSTCASVHAST